MIAGAVLCTALAMLLPASCDVYDGLKPCPRGMNLRFVFDYTLEQGNAFPEQVNDYILHIYDEQGNYLKSYSEAGERLSDENYRLQVDLPHGNYHFVVYGYGKLEGGERLFEPVVPPAEGCKLSDLRVRMSCFDGMSDRLLQDFFYGSLDVTVEGERYRDTTIHLMRNTNSIRVLLQHLDGSPVPVDGFKFSITDDNSLFDASNNLIPNGTVTYLPWISGIAGAGSGSGEVQAGFVEFSTSRLTVGSGSRLVVRRLSDGDVVLDIPLSQYLVLSKSEKYANMDAQEYLDRQSDWSMVLFLDSLYKWINTRIIVNGWTVRLNETGL